jgi:hypothetical protein
MRAVSLVRLGLASTLLGVAVLTACLGGAVTTSAGASTKLAAPTCSTVTPKMIGQYLKLTVAPPKRSAAAGGDDFLCEYGDKTSSLAVVIEYDTASTLASFTTVEDGFANNDMPTTGVGRDFGTHVNLAFSATFGSGPYAQHSVVILQKKLFIDIASSAPVNDLVALMEQVVVRV